MPLARIDVNKDTSAEVVKVICNAVYDAMIGPAKVPENDQFQIVTRHTTGELVYPKAGYMGIEYTRNIIFIQITWLAGRTTDVKKTFFAQIANDIATKGKVRKQDTSSASSNPVRRLVVRERRDAIRTEVVRLSHASTGSGVLTDPSSS